MTDAVTNADKLRCVKRELAIRRRWYRKWTDIGQMSAGKAAHEIACMESIVADYEAADMAAEVADFWKEEDQHERTEQHSSHPTSTTKR